MLEVSKLLAMAKDIGGLHLIVVGEVFLRLMNHSFLRVVSRTTIPH
jgi:hypothetical protein